MNQNSTKSVWRPANPHDRFGRKTVGNAHYASDFLKHYADSSVAECVNLDHLVTAPTHFLSEKLKEVILDMAFVARLQETESNSEVLMFIEHKSKPSQYIALQLGAQAFISLYGDWTATGYSESAFVPKIPLMIVLYNGQEDFDDDVFFQNIFSNIPEKLRRFVPQFQVIVINLKKFDYDHLPGKPETQAIVESLKRATDGTFGDQLGCVLQHFVGLELNQQIRNLIAAIVTYCSWTSSATSEQIAETITTTFTGPEGIEMTDAYLKDSVLKGELKGKVDSILVILRNKFEQVPYAITNVLRQRTDAVALESLVVLAASCSSLDEFAAELE